MRQDQTYSPNFHYYYSINNYNYIGPIESCISLSLIPIVPIDMKLGICTVCIDSYIGTRPQIFTLINPFTTRVPIVIDPSHTLVYELSSSNDAHTRHDQTYSLINPFATRVLGSSH